MSQRPGVKPPRPQPSKKRDLEEPWLATLQDFPLTDRKENSLKKTAYTLPVFVFAHFWCNLGVVLCRVGTNGDGGLRWDATAQDTESASAQEACVGTQQPRHQERNVSVVALTTTTGRQRLPSPITAALAP